MRWLLGKIVTLILVGLIIGGYTDFPAKSNEFKAREIAHRGLTSAAPENTASSIRAAANKKVEYAELDVQETKDGYVVLMHDKNLKRVAGINKCIGDMNYNQLEKIDIGKLYSRKFIGERVPTLDNIIDMSKGKIKLDIEIKCYNREDDLTEKVVEIIQKHNFQNQCIVTSFDYNVLVHVKKLDPTIKTSYIVYSKVNHMPSDDIDIYSVEKDYVNQRLVNEIHRNKKQIHVWTINRKSEIVKFIKMKVDYVITNRV